MGQKPIAEEEKRGAGGSPPRGPGGAAEETPLPQVPVDEQLEADAEQAAEAVSEDLDQLTAVKRERDEYLELAQRTKADFDNYRKRVAKEASEALARGRAELARELIPVLDNLERAVGTASDEDASTNDALARGVALVLEELRATLARAGVEAYDPAGERFDPSWHEALSTVPAEGAEPGTVVETLERGYRLDGQLLRPARVVVSE